MHIRVKTNHPSNEVFTQGKIYDVECRYDGDGKVRLAKVFNDQGHLHLINLIGPCAFLDSKGKWEVLKCDG